MQLIKPNCQYLKSQFKDSTWIVAQTATTSGIQLEKEKIHFSITQPTNIRGITIGTRGFCTHKWFKNSTASETKFPLFLLLILNKFKSTQTISNISWIAHAWLQTFTENKPQKMSWVEKKKANPELRFQVLSGLNKESVTRMYTRTTANMVPNGSGLRMEKWELRERERVRRGRGRLESIGQRERIHEL